MLEAIVRAIIKSRHRAVEIILFAIAGSALFAQIGCRGEVYARSGQIHVRDVEFRPDFVIARQSPEAPTYWVRHGHPIHVRWGQIISDPGCDLCALQACSEPPPAFKAPAIVVSHWAPGSDIENERFLHTRGCGQSWNAVFTPTEPEGNEERSYRTSIQFPGGGLIPDESVRGGRLWVVKTEFEMPPRRLSQTGERTWTWPRMPDTPAAATLEEAFDPDLRVGKIVIVRGQCGIPIGDYECGKDYRGSETFRRGSPIVPYRVIVRDVPGLDCVGDPTQPDGDINVGPDPRDRNHSLCRPDNVLQLTTPNFTLSEASTSAAGRLIWRVEFDADRGFPPPSPGEDLWILFTLVPTP